MTPEHVVLLDELGFVWDPLEEAWNEGYERLKAFQEREGHCRVTKRYRDEAGNRLGQWVSVQRRTRDTMTPERVDLLDELGFVWKAG